MVSSTEILKRTGLRSTKTLTRWHRRGIIPEPTVGTHPSGRGKIAYWPDWVLDRCVRIVELQRQGHTLASAVAALEHERVERLIQEVQDAPSTSEVLAEKRVQLKDGREVDALSVFHAVVLAQLRDLAVEPSARDLLAAKLRDDDVVSHAIDHLSAGYNPVLVFDGKKARVVADFVLSLDLSDHVHPPSSLVIPLMHPLKKAFSMLGRELAGEASVRPAPRVWAREGDVTVEYGVALGGSLGFELLRQTAKTVGRADPSEFQDD